jgi:Fur family peroxide stress response transcriptional regulator
MRSEEYTETLREVGLVPTIQRLAVLDCLAKSKQHPTADQVLGIVRKKFPSISRATVYNTLDALTKAKMVLRLNVDPTVARYDADLEPHAHFRCRVCQKVYDIEVKDGKPVDVETDGHLVESIRTYAYGVCASCREKDGSVLLASDQMKESETPSSPVPPPTNQAKSIQKKPLASSSGPPSESGKSSRKKKALASSSPAPDPSNRSESFQKKELQTPSSSGPPNDSEEVQNA